MILHNISYFSICILRSQWSYTIFPTFQLIFLRANDLTQYCLFFNNFFWDSRILHNIGYLQFICNLYFWESTILVCQFYTLHLYWSLLIRCLLIWWSSPPQNFLFGQTFLPASTFTSLHCHHFWLNLACSNKKVVFKTIFTTERKDYSNNLLL